MYVLLRWIKGRVNEQSLSCMYVSFMWVGVEVEEGRIGDSVRFSIDLGGVSVHSRGGRLGYIHWGGIHKDIIGVIGVTGVVGVNKGAGCNRAGEGN